MKLARSDAMPKSHTLEREMQTFRDHHDQLLGSHREKYVLIKGAEIVGFFASPEDALKRGYELYGNQPFLVRQIVEVEYPQYYSSFQIGSPESLLHK